MRHRGFACWFLLVCASGEERRWGRLAGEAVNFCVGFQVIRAFAASLGIRPHDRARPTFPALRFSAHAALRVVQTARLVVVRDDNDGGGAFRGALRQLRWWTTLQLAPPSRTTTRDSELSTMRPSDLYWIEYNSSTWDSAETTFWLERKDEGGDLDDDFDVVRLSAEAQADARGAYEESSGAIANCTTKPILFGLVEFEWDEESETARSLSVLSPRATCQQRRLSSRSRRDRCGRRAARAAKTWALIVAVLVATQLALAPIAKTFVVVGAARRVEEEKNSSSRVAGVVRRAAATVRATALERSDDPLLWPRILWPLFPLAVCGVALAAADPAFCRTECWSRQFGVLVLAVLLGSYLFYFLPIVRRLEAHDAVFVATPTPPTTCSLSKCLFKAVFSGGDHFDECRLGEWRDCRARRFVSSHGAAFEDFVAPHAEVLVFVAHDVLSAVAVGLGALYSPRVQLLSLLAVRGVAAVAARASKPFANVAINVVLVSQLGLECLAVGALTLGHYFDGRILFGVFELSRATRAVSITCHAVVFCIVLGLPSVASVASIFFSACRRLLVTTDDASTSYPGQTASFASLALRVPVFDAIIDALRYGDFNACCLTWLILVGHEIAVLARWAVGGCPSFSFLVDDVDDDDKEELPEEEDDPGDGERVVEEDPGDFDYDDREYDDDRFATMSVAELTDFIKSHDGSDFSDCRDKAVLVDRARKTAQSVELPPHPTYDK